MLSATPTDLFNLLLQYKFLIIFPLAVVEGPILSVICGFLISLGLLSLPSTLFLIVFGDLVGDTLYYFVGKWGRRLFAKRLHATKLDTHFKKHSRRTIIFGKIAHGAGSFILIAAGAAHTPFGEFLLFNLIPTIPKMLFFLAIGYFFGAQYQRIGSILDVVAWVVIAILASIAVYLLTRSLQKQEIKLEEQEG